jgi:hypothetical protein
MICVRQRTDIPSHAVYISPYQPLLKEEARLWLVTAIFE